MYLTKLVKLSCFVALGFLISSCEGDSGGSNSSDGSSTGNTGRGGSTARMVIDGDYLYAIADSDIQLFTITTPSQPQPWATVNIARGIETLFPYGDYLLIGGRDGMYVMDNRDRAAPGYLSEFTHARARDPVVAHNGFAYVTLKDDGSFGSTNQMDVINLFDIYNPSLERTLAMQGPEGLSVFENRLFVCDGRAGIKIFDVTNPASPTFTESIANVDCNDVIAIQGLIYVITDDSLIQYDTSVSPPVLLSEVLAEG